MLRLSRTDGGLLLVDQSGESVMVSVCDRVVFVVLVMAVIVDRFSGKRKCCLVVFGRGRQAKTLMRTVCLLGSDKATGVSVVVGWKVCLSGSEGVGMVPVDSAVLSLLVGIDGQQRCRCRCWC